MKKYLQRSQEARIPSTYSCNQHKVYACIQQQNFKKGFHFTCFSRPVLHVNMSSVADFIKVRLNKSIKESLPSPMTHRGQIWLLSCRGRGASAVSLLSPFSACCCRIRLGVAHSEMNSIKANSCSKNVAEPWPINLQHKFTDLYLVFQIPSHFVSPSLTSR